MGTIPQELLTAVRDASNWVRYQVGESANDIARLDAPPENVTTGNWEALDDFAVAEKQANEMRLEEAITNLRSAVKIDPGFYCLCRLGDLLFARNRRLDGYQAYLTALNNDSGQRLSRKERDFIEGSFASDTGDYQTGTHCLPRLQRFLPK